MRTAKNLLRSFRGAPGSHLCLGFFLVVHLAVALSIVLQTRPVIWPLHNDTVHRTGPAGDFYSVYNAAINLRRGVDPYSGSPDGITPYKFPYRYLPAVAVAFQPFTLLPPKLAWVTWILGLETLLGALVVSMWRRITPIRTRLVTVGALLVSSPYFLELYMGQFTFAAVSLLGLALLYPARNPAYGLSALLKPLTLAAVPALAIQRPYRRHAVWAIVAVLAASLPYFVAFPEQWTEFFTANFTAQSSFDAGNFGMVRFLTMLTNDMHFQPLGLPWTAWVTGLRIIILAGTALLVIYSRSDSVVAGATALLLGHFLTFPDVWEHHVSAMCVLSAVLIEDRTRRGLPTAPLLVSLVILALPSPFVLFDAEKDPSIWDPSASWPAIMRYLLVLPKVAPCAVLYVIAVRQLSRARFLPSRDAWRRLVVSR